MIFGNDADAKGGKVVVDLLEEVDDDTLGAIDDDFRLSDVSLDVDDAF